MTYPTCATCVFWERDDHRALRDLRILDPATYQPIPQPFEIGVCQSPKLREFERPEQDGASTMDGSEYFSALVTGPDFGCIHHAPE